MELLKMAIQTQGIVRSESILDVSCFLNGQVDAQLMEAIGNDFAEHFKDLDFDLFVTVESSGIAPSVFASLASGKPLVVIKKSAHEMDATVYAQRESFSFTKNNHYLLTSKRALIENKKVVLLDDFLAQGSVVLNVEALLESVGATLEGVGICITKCFQPGYEELQKKGYNLYSQANIAGMDPETNAIHFI